MKKLLKFRKNHNGFTLVELVIVIAIVIILSVISVPIYRGYVDKSKMAEGYALLGTILSAQKAYYSEYGNFVKDTGSNRFRAKDNLLGVDASGNKYFTCFNLYVSSDPKNAFNARLMKPAELLNDTSLLRVAYSIEDGTILFYESN